MKTVEEAILAAARCLQGVGIDNPQRESEFLVAALLQTPRTHLLLHRGQSLEVGQIRALRRWLRARELRKPLAYISGEQPFRDLVLKVNASVLVPRPETELVVEQALRLLDKSPKPITIADVGTGSGNIALSLSMHSKAALVVGIDRSAAAIKVARANHHHAPHGAPVRWMRGNLLAPLAKARLHAGLIVANLPYVRTADLPDLEPELQWEPPLALDGGPDGLRLIEPCIQQAAGVLWPGGSLLLEIGFDQSKAVTALFQQGNVWEDVRIFRDLSGLPRIAQARRRGA